MTLNREGTRFPSPLSAKEISPPLTVKEHSTMTTTKGTTTKDPRVGTRVELPAFSDQWMRGARFGTVTRVFKRSGEGMNADDVLWVRCDHPSIRRLYKHFALQFRWV